MSLVDGFANVVVVLAGLYMLALGVASLVVPVRASKFLLSFAGSQSAHFTELLLRLAAGAAFVLYAPHMSVPGAFNLFGWVLIVTTTCLVFIPWRRHRHFAQQSVPRATRHITLLGLVSLTIGALIFAAVSRGSTA